MGRCAYALLATLLMLSPKSDSAFVAWGPPRSAVLSSSSAARRPCCSRRAAWPSGDKGRFAPICRSETGASHAYVVQLAPDAAVLQNACRAEDRAKGFAKLHNRSKPPRVRKHRTVRRSFHITLQHTREAMASESDEESRPLLRNQIQTITRLEQAKQVRPKSVGLHPAEKSAVSASAAGARSRTMTLKRRAGSDDRSAQTRSLFRAKSEELAILRDSTVPFGPGQPVFCANDNGRLVRGTLLSVERGKNRLLVGKVRLHERRAPDVASRRGEDAGGSSNEEEFEVKKFRLPAIFPIGGCNGGLESELEKFVSFDETSDFHGAADLEAAVDTETGLSALSWLTAGRAPAVDDILLYLEEQKLRLMHMPFREHTLEFEAGHLGQARQGLKSALVDAETRLLRFCEVLAHTLFRLPGDSAEFARSTGVNCEIGSKGPHGQREHFKVEEPLPDDLLYHLMSGEGFGKTGICDHLVSNLRVMPINAFRYAHMERQRRVEARRQKQTGADGSMMDYLGSLGEKETLEPGGHGDLEPMAGGAEAWSEVRQLSHYLIYEAKSPAQVDASGGVLRFFGSRKSASELLDIVADKLCHVDEYVGSTASRGYSDCRQIHNALSVRIVVESSEQALELLSRLERLVFSQRVLHQADVPWVAHGTVPPGLCTDRVQMLEVHNRLEGGLQQTAPGSTTLMREEEAKVGWRGLVAMVKWWGAPIMIVMEPLEVYHLQQELSTSMSYGQYKERQRKARCAVERRWPIYQLMRALTHWALGGERIRACWQCDVEDAHVPPPLPQTLSRVKLQVAVNEELQDKADGVLSA